PIVNPDGGPRMRLRDHLRGKLYAARTLAQFASMLENWRAVWDAYRGKAPIPPLRLRGGITLYHEPGDDTFALFREIFLDHCYTRAGFYRPRPADTVIDLGANVGFFALYLQWRARGIRIHCFEPAVETRRRLGHNIEANHLTESVE